MNLRRRSRRRCRPPPAGTLGRMIDFLVGIDAAVGFSPSCSCRCISPDGQPCPAFPQNWKISTSPCLGRGRHLDIRCPGQPSGARPSGSATVRKFGAWSQRGACTVPDGTVVRSLACRRSRRRGKRHHRGLRPGQRAERSALVLVAHQSVVRRWSRLSARRAMVTSPPSAPLAASPAYDRCIICREWP